MFDIFYHRDHQSHANCVSMYIHINVKSKSFTLNNNHFFYFAHFHLIYDNIIIFKNIH